MANVTPVKIQVDLKALFICSCGFAFEESNIPGVIRHPTRWGAQDGGEIKCEFAGRLFKSPYATLEEYLP